MVRHPGIGEVYHDGEGEIVVVDEDGDIKPTDDYSAELDLSDKTDPSEQEFDEESYIKELRSDEIRAIADAAISSTGSMPSAKEYGLDLSADDDRLVYIEALKRVIAKRQAEIDTIAATSEYEREGQVYGPYNDNSPQEYYAGPLHEKTWNMALELIPVRHELRWIEEANKNDKDQ